MNSPKKYLLPLLILILFVSLVVGFRSFLISNIIEPIALLFWAIWRVVSSIDQDIYWMLLILICIILIIYLVALGKQRSHASAYHETNKSLSRVEYWQQLIIESASEESEREYLRANLKTLLTTADALSEELKSDDSAEVTTKQDVSLSSSAYRFLHPQEEKSGWRSKFHTPDFMFLAPKWLRRQIRYIFFRDNALIDEILHVMENKLEINNEK